MLEKFITSMNTDQIDKINVEEVMTRCPETVDEDSNISVAHILMKGKQIRHLPVVHLGKLTGVLSDRDLKMVSLLPQKDKISVSEVMTRSPVTVEETSSLISVLKTMVWTKVGSVVVMGRTGKIAGIFTTQDALRLLLKERGLYLPAPTAWPDCGEDEED